MGFYAFCVTVAVVLLHSRGGCCSFVSGRASTSFNVSELDAPTLSSWVQSSDPEVDCGQFQLCTAENMTYRYRGSSLHYTAAPACEMLSRLQVSNIYFFGDSYLRHIAAGFHAILNNDFNLYTQVALKRHEEHRINYLCNGTVKSHIFVRTFPNIGFMSKENNSMVLMSYGNHPTAPFRVGVNNATCQMERFVNSCKSFAGKKHNYTKHFLMWVSTHARVVAHFPDEAPLRVEQFNDEMRYLIENGRCTSDTLFIDVFNMSKSLVQLSDSNNTTKKVNIKSLTPDGVHWGRNVNLIKTQIILSEMDWRLHRSFVTQALSYIH